ncbi:hypothetical protein VKT23_020687 [Stygiomarasmius scandens]|uniref:Uncharacterized protein n=1 Tax=Marasmiellus scandens TaxID=2682957 RepID=A0ABR1IIJ3_9AGAR
MGSAEAKLLEFPNPEMHDRQIKEFHALLHADLVLDRLRDIKSVFEEQLLKNAVLKRQVIDLQRENAALQAELEKWRQFREEAIDMANKTLEIIDCVAEPESIPQRQRKTRNVNGKIEIFRDGAWK